MSSDSAKQPSAWDLVIADATTYGHPPPIITDMRARKDAVEVVDGAGASHLVLAYENALDLIMQLRCELRDRNVDIGTLLRVGPSGVSSLPGEDTIDLVDLYAGALNALVRLWLHLPRET